MKTIKKMSDTEIISIGTKALMDALGPVGYIRYLDLIGFEGSGDYTKEKYDYPEPNEKERKEIWNRLLNEQQ